MTAAAGTAQVTAAAAAAEHRSHGRSLMMSAPSTAPQRSRPLARPAASSAGRRLLRTLAESPEAGVIIACVVVFIVIAINAAHLRQRRQPAGDGPRPGPGRHPGHRRVTGHPHRRHRPVGRRAGRAWPASSPPGSTSTRACPRPAGDPDHPGHLRGRRLLARLDGHPAQRAAVRDHAGHLHHRAGPVARDHQRHADQRHRLAVRQRVLGLPRADPGARHCSSSAPR